MKKPSLIPRERLIHQIQRSPFVDWVIILAVSGLAALVLVGVGVSVYLETGDMLSAPASAELGRSRLPLSDSVLQKVLNDFDARAAERSRLTDGYGAPEDPSLP